jgi:hypothetical protein
MSFGRQVAIYNASGRRVLCIIGVMSRLVVDRGQSRARHRYYWHRPTQRTRAEKMVILRMRWLAMDPGTSGDRAQISTWMSSIRRESFRLVDVHGRSYGPRYTGANERVDSPAQVQCLAHDAQGRPHWFAAGTRVRVVKRQQEDLRSHVSRMLRAAHRRGE